MRIIIDIDDEDINRMTGEQGAKFFLGELRRDPLFFITAASQIAVNGEFGMATHQK